MPENTISDINNSLKTDEVEGKSEAFGDRLKMETETFDQRFHPIFENIVKRPLVQKKLLQEAHNGKKGWRTSEQEDKYNLVFDKKLADMLKHVTPDMCPRYF